MNATTETRPILEAKGVSRDYLVKRGMFSPVASVKALQGVSFDLEQRLALLVYIHIILSDAENQVMIAQHVGKPTTFLRHALQLLHEIVV